MVRVIFKIRDRFGVMVLVKDRVRLGLELYLRLELGLVSGF